MAAAPKVTLGPATLDQSREVVWHLQAGVDPVMEVFEADAAEAAKLLPGGGPHTLTVTVDGQPTLKVDGLYVVGEVQSQDPHRRALVVADRRVWWPRVRVFGRFNIRRRTGSVRRLNADGSLPQQIAPTVDDVAYAKWSTKDETGKAFTGGEIVDRVLKAIDPEGWSGGAAAGTYASKAVDHVEIDDPGPSAARRALDFLVGADVVVGYDGKVGLTRTLDLKAAGQVFERLGGEYVGSSHVARVNLSKQRPGKIVGLFSVEQEIRVDSIESGDYGFTDQRGMENVAPVPDATLTVNGVTYVQGTYLTFDQLFTGWNADKGGADVPDISHAKVRKFYLTPFLESLYGGLGLLAPYANWVARIATVRAHYRQTWRIKRSWVDRIFSMRAYRVAIVDQETGTFAPSVAYAGYCLIPSTKGLFYPPNLQCAMLNVDGSVAAGQKLSEGKVAPCRVTIVDEEQGILRLDYHGDLLGNYRQVIPSKVKNVCLVAFDQMANPRTMDGSIAGRGGVGVDLEDENRVSVVVTVTPCAPNSKAQLYPVEVTAAEAAEYLPADVRGAVGNAVGPTWELRIFPGLATARFAWNDDKASAIERSFGVGLKADQASPGARGGLDDLLQNPTETRDLARSLAAGLLASMADRHEGTWTGAFSPALLPVGNIRRVTHRLSVDGRPSTSVEAPNLVAPVDGLALLPDSARRLFLRTAQP